jgi:hypothetical protein
VRRLGLDFAASTLDHGREPTALYIISIYRPRYVEPDRYCSISYQLQDNAALMVTFRRVILSH